MKLIYLLIALSFVFAACTKDKEDNYVSAEVNGISKSTKNIDIELHPQTGEPYIFQAKFSNFTIGFKLVLTQPGDYLFKTTNPLPASLISFTLGLANRTPVLKWKTSQETNLQSFVIERSRDGLNFSILHTMAGTNTNTVQLYEYADEETNVIGRYYYRLKMVDSNGQFAYSTVLVYTNEISYIAYVMEGGDKYKGYNGNVKIISHDRTKHIIEGLFSFDAKTNTAQIIEVRNGRFKIEY